VAHGGVTTAPVQGDPGHLLGRLNRRGFRLLHLADAALLGTGTVAIMFVRFGTPWRTDTVRQ